VFENLKIPFERTEKTQAPSFTKNFLQEHEHPVVNMIAKAREVNKAHTTFIDSILRYEHKGRIHAEINQLVMQVVVQLQVDSLIRILTYNRFQHVTKIRT